MEMDILESKQTYCSLKCFKCGFIKKYKINPKHKLWVDQAEAVVDTLKFSNNHSKHSNPSSSPITKEDKKLESNQIICKDLDINK